MSVSLSRVLLATTLAGSSLLLAATPAGATTGSPTGPPTDGSSTAAPASAAYPGGNGLIATTVTTAAGYDVQVERLDGAAPRRITTDGTSSKPVFSPDGRTIAYDDDGRLAFMNPDGSGKRRTGIAIAPPRLEGQTHSWTPDGTRLAVVTPTGLKLVTRSTGTVVRTLLTRGYTRASFHPTDGDRLLVGDRTVLRLSTGRTWQLSIAPATRLDRVTDVQWTADGKNIAFLSNCDPNGFCTDALNLFVAPAKGGVRQDLTGRTTATHCHPSGSCSSLEGVVPAPDGRDFLIHESFDNGAGTTCVYRYTDPRTRSCSSFDGELYLGDWQAKR